MHMLVSNTEYQIVTIKLACQASQSESRIADGLNEMLNNGLYGDRVYDDWAIEFSDKFIETSSSPEEGELFE